MLVSERCVGYRPQALGGLEFGRVGGQEQPMRMVGYAQFHAGMPARAVEDQRDLFAWAGADLARERR